MRLAECVPCSSGNRSKGHVICVRCFNDYIVVPQTSLAEFSKNGRRIVCKDCSEIDKVHSPYSEQTLANYCTSLSFCKYQHVREDAIKQEESRKVEAQRARDEARHQNELHQLQLQIEQDVKNRREAEIAHHRGHIMNSFLNNLCPAYSLAVYDFEGCFAVQHKSEYTGKKKVSHTVGCLKYFCGWCHEVFDGNTSCHDHMKVCPRGRHQGTYFGFTPEYNAARAMERKDDVERYLRSTNINAPI